MTLPSTQQRAFDEISQLLDRIDNKINSKYGPFVHELNNNLKNLNIRKKNEMVQQIKIANENQLTEFTDKLALQELPKFTSENPPSELPSFDNEILQSIPLTVDKIANEMRKMEQKIKSIQQLDMDLYQENYVDDEYVIRESLSYIEEYESSFPHKSNHILVEECKNLKLQALELLDDQNSKIKAINKLQSDTSNLRSSINPLIEHQNTLSDSNYTFIRENDLYHLLEDENGNRLMELDETRLLLEPQLQKILKILKLSPFSNREELLNALDYKANDELINVNIEDDFLNYSDYMSNVDRYNEQRKHVESQQILIKNELRSNIAALDDETQKILQLESEITEIKQIINDENI
eukprot:NODE_600_length_6246_cov_0.137628.p2 type:complete len:352 gc:universal NODE_600_length_6246_cov_0.137628:2424-1369(-)